MTGHQGLRIGTYAGYGKYLEEHPIKYQARGPLMWGLRKHCVIGFVHIFAKRTLICQCTLPQGSKYLQSYKLTKILTYITTIPKTEYLTIGSFGPFGLIREHLLPIGPEP